MIIGVLTQGDKFTITASTVAAIKGFTVDSVAPEGMEILGDVSYLLNRGGMISMANVVMICYTGFALTAILIRCGILDKAVEPLMHFANTLSLIHIYTIRCLTCSLPKSTQLL